MTVKIEHVQYITMRGSHNNNKMERFNGEIRDREKVMRSPKRTDTPILRGYQIFHNYIRQHMALNGDTHQNEPESASRAKMANNHPEHI